ncbi:hypothetical protein [Bacillus toyonensis]|uniref:hypothetical protein n=1 Tax=Bacillus toyonensis TaxID=155322 RepID=UPI002E21A7F9|nr:hypothetical protein [Bacillus toyonensis]
MIRKDLSVVSDQEIVVLVKKLRKMITEKKELIGTGIDENAVFELQDEINGFNKSLKVYCSEVEKRDIIHQL